MSGCQCRFTYPGLCVRSFSTQNRPAMCATGWCENHFLVSLITIYCFCFRDDPHTVDGDLGVYLDSNMSVRSHVTRLVCTCFGILRQIRSIRRSVPRSTLSTLISSFVVSKLDYCNAALAGRPSCDLDRHQRCSTPDSWRTAPRPHHSAPCGHPLAAHTSAHPIQAVHTGLPVRTWVRT